MKIAVIGSGYVGLVTGTCFAQTGNSVICVDNDPAKLEKLRSGQLPIYEPGLDKLFLRNVNEGRLTFTDNLEKAVKESEIIMLALPTPSDEDGSADLSAVMNVAEQIEKVINGYKLIVCKSTVPVGTSERVEKIIAKNNKSDFDVASNPEFLREGVAVSEFQKPDRVVVGCKSEKAREMMSRLYEPFVRQGNPIIFTDLRSAEMIKYAANAYLATRISFINEIANLCDRTGADAGMVRKGMGADSRIGKRFLFPGIGYGGSCFPKDVRALANTSREHNYGFKILDAVMRVNENQKKIPVEKLKQHFGPDLSGKKIAIWGLAFKPGTDDIREAPSLTIIEKLLKAGAEVSVFDPEALENAKIVFGKQITYAEGQYRALWGADALIIATEWDVFRSPDFEKMAIEMNGKVIFDGRNLYRTEQMKDTKFTYYSIGRETING